MNIQREEHDAKISALEARTEARVSRIEAIGLAMQEEIREIRKELRSSILEFRREMRENKRLTIAMFVTVLIAIFGTGITTVVAFHQSMARSMDNMLAAFATGKSTQPTIHVIPHSIVPAYERQAAVFNGQPVERNE